MLRQAHSADVPGIQAVRHSVRENRLVSTVISDADVVEAIERTGRGWVIEVAGQVVAFAVGNAQSGNIWALFVHPDHERRGYGRRLHDTMVDWLWSRGLDRLWLTTEPGTRAQTFYEAAGWQRVGTTNHGELCYELKRGGLVAGAATRHAMDPEPLSSHNDPDWLSMRLALWPDCPRDQHLEEMARFLREPGRYAQFIVRSPDGRGIGFAEASIRTDYVNGTVSSPVGYLEGLFVREPSRGQGVARRLVEAVSRWAMAHGCSELASDTQPENLVSREAHRRLGFVETERAVFFSRPLKPAS